MGIYVNKSKKTKIRDAKKKTKKYRYKGKTELLRTNWESLPRPSFNYRWAKMFTWANNLFSWAKMFTRRNFFHHTKEANFSSCS